MIEIPIHVGQDIMLSGKNLQKEIEVILHALDSIVNCLHCFGKSLCCLLYQFGISVVWKILGVTEGQSLTSCVSNVLLFCLNSVVQDIPGVIINYK